jgi:RNA polymerase sigma factor (TIGR02999 family)
MSDRAGKDQFRNRTVKEVAHPGGWIRYKVVKLPRDHSNIEQGEVTELLCRASAGDSHAADDLMAIVERELRRLAAAHMRREREGHTLQTTAVVNEAFLRLFGTDSGRQIHWNDRQHFLAAASQAMRRILVDHARAGRAAKRNAVTIPMESVEIGEIHIDPDLIDIHTALDEFAAIAPRQARLVELRFFGGLTLEEAAGVLGISVRLADKDWALARAWLRRRLSFEEPPKAQFRN